MLFLFLPNNGFAARFFLFCSFRNFFFVRVFLILQNSTTELQDSVSVSSRNHLHA